MPPSVKPSEFFTSTQNRAAAVLKHGVLSRYLRPFAAKTGSTSVGKRVVILDGYAGAGRYEDGSPGSPLIMAQAARDMTYRTIDLVLVEKDRSNFEKLTTALSDDGVVLRFGPINASVEDKIDEIVAFAHDAPLLAFLDPCGMGLPFETIVELFDRFGGEVKTELLLNFSADAIRRIGGLLSSPTSNAGSTKTLARLDDVCGGPWWRATYLENLGSDDSTEAVAVGYLKRLNKEIRGAGWVVPVRREEHHKPIYHLVFLTRHRDGMYYFGEAVSNAQADWRRALHEGNDLFGEPAFFDESERVLAESWVGTIAANLRGLLTDSPTIHLGSKWSETFGEVLGEARQTHLRTALRELHRAGLILEVPKGDLWLQRISRV